MLPDTEAVGGQYKVVEEKKRGGGREERKKSQGFEKNLNSEQMPYPL